MVNYFLCNRRVIIQSVFYDYCFTVYNRKHRGRCSRSICKSKISGLDFFTENGKTPILLGKATQKWQYLNSYADGVVEVDTSGRYLLTNETLNTIGVNWYFLGACLLYTSMIS